MCINNQHIPYINIVKYIGVHLDNKLRWQLLKLKMCSNIIAIPTTENSCIILYNYLFSYLLLVHGITFQKDFLVLFLPFRRKTRLIKWASVCVSVYVCVCVCLCVCVSMRVCLYVCVSVYSFGPPLTISKPVIRFIRNFGYI